MKRLGFVVYDVSLTGGAENVALNMATELSEKYEVHMISLFCEKNFDSEKYPFQTHIISSETVIIPTHLISLSNKLRKIIKSKNIDIIFAITAGIVTVAALATRFIDTKLIYCEHSNLENQTYGIKHKIRQLIGARFSDRVVTLTERDRSNFIKKYNLNEEIVSSIPNWFVAKTSDCTEYNSDSKKIISVGRLEKVKGYDMLVKAAVKVYKAHPQWHWDIYGDGKFRAQIEQWISDAGLTDFITLKGNVTDLSERYSGYSMFVMTSYYEGLPLVLLEAQVASLPVISFDCPTGPAEIITENINGHLVPPYNTDLLAEKIISLIENKNRREAFSSNATVNLSKFSKDVVLCKWISLIENI